jgi:hypothetical protein
MTPVICVELHDTRISTRDRASLRNELLSIAASHPQTAQIRHVLFNARLPVDPRHNSKIERPALARWAGQQLRRERKPARQLAA